MSDKPFMGTGYSHPKAREKAHAIELAASVLHRLPRIAQVNEAWVADSWTVELEMQTESGQRVILPLHADAIANLHAYFGELLALQNTDE